MRPVWMEYPKDAAAFAIEDEHLLGINHFYYLCLLRVDYLIGLFFSGDALLVHPVTHMEVSSVKVYFPGQNVLWYEVENYQVYQGAGYQTVPVTIEKVLHLSLNCFTYFYKCHGFQQQIFFADSCFPERWSHCFQKGKSTKSFYCHVKGSLYPYRYFRPAGMF